MSVLPTSGGTPSLRVRAEAAAWLAGLRRSNRTSDLEARFRRWLAESESNRIAWERQSHAWELAGALMLRFESPRVRRTAPRRAGRRYRAILSIGAVLSAALVALTLASLFTIGTGAMSTAMGERRVAVLPDGSRVTLNTDTRIVVQYAARVRGVRLVRGEALFDVRKGSRRPFVVVAGTRAIRALAAAFEVRRDPGREVSVTLIDGRISLGRIDGPIRDRAPDGRADLTVLDSPGERVTFVPHRAPTVDHPVLRQIIAWQSGDVVFDDTPLPEAAREMNRYGERQIRVQGRDVGSLRVGGLFHAGESVEFARAVAETFGLEMHESGREIVLAGADDALSGSPAPSAPDAGSPAPGPDGRHRD